MACSQRSSGSERNGRMLFVPRGFAHGLVTLEDDTEIFYQMDQFHNPESSRGIRWDDETFKISWPVKPKVISVKDMSWKPFTG